jgi:hypothetical protein
MPEKATRTLRVLVAEDVTLNVLRTALSDERLTWAYASRMEDTGLGWLHDLLSGDPLGAPQSGKRPGVELGRWNEGRAFGPDLEIDWWREGSLYRLRALLEEGDPPSEVSWGVTSEPLERIGDERAVLLYGLLDEEASRDEEPTWSEARIPRRLLHPVQGNERPPRAVLFGCDYGHSGVVTLTRLVKVGSIIEKEQQA